MVVSRLGRGVRRLSSRASDSEARDLEFDTYLRRVVSEHCHLVMTTARVLYIPSLYKTMLRALSQGDNISQRIVHTNIV